MSKRARQRDPKEKEMFKKPRKLLPLFYTTYKTCETWSQKLYWRLLSFETMNKIARKRVQKEISCQKVTATIFPNDKLMPGSAISFVIPYFYESFDEQIFGFEDIDSTKRINSVRRRKNRMNKKFCGGPLGRLGMGD